jgi:hypothetical protein
LASKGRNVRDTADEKKTGENKASQARAQHRSGHGVGVTVKGGDVCVVDWT